MSLATLLPYPKHVVMRELIDDGDGIRAVVATTATEASCPVCGSRAIRVHSRYRRQVADLPWHGVPFRLELHLRRFFCDQSTCARRIFAERLPEIVAPYARRTVALADVFTLMGFALGGEAGARLARRMATLRTAPSADTVLRLIRRHAIRVAPPPRVLGVDDFAFQRGRRYGTILVDLERRQVVDVLPDREAATFATWLKAHPGVEIISRDRGGAYAEGARQAAPHAQQVADRFHLLQNLGSALDALLTREHDVLAQVAKDTHQVREEPAALHTTPEELSADAAEPRGAAASGPLPTTRQERAHLASEARRQARYAQVMQLHAAGHPLHTIARLVGLARNTVRRYVCSPTPPVSAPRRRRVHACDPFAAFLQQRWADGEHNSTVLLKELRAKGCLCSASTVRHYLMPWRTGPRRPGRRPLHEISADSADSAGNVLHERPRRTFSPRQTRWLLLQPLEELDEQAYAYRHALCAASPTIEQARTLITDFWRLLCPRTAPDTAGSQRPIGSPEVDDTAAIVTLTGALDAWLVTAAQSAIPEFVSFATGVRRDYDAVAAAVWSKWSQGQTEGQVNRLKVLKRTAYGRANLDLLRLRLLAQIA
ncbi:MAG TPA: ISL3 family transposase [Ktedonobacterales bacterium]|nr:ISL3 family transposase [Ktedonobacterales bacterium]